MHLRCLPALVLLALPVAECPASAWLGLQMTRVPAAPFAAGDGARLEGLQYRVTASVPDNPLLPGIDYRYTRYEYEGLNGRNRDLHRLELPFEFAGSFGSWQWEGAVAPGISASSNVFKEPLKRWGGDDLTLWASFEATRPAGNNWSMHAGLVRDQRFGRPLVYPTVGAEFARGAWMLRLAVPDSEVRYRPIPGHTLTARVYPAGHRWHVVSDELADEFDYRVRAWRADLTWSADLFGKLTLDLAGGYAFARRHRLTDDTGTRFSVAVDGQWTMSIGLRTSAAPLP